eukprot:5090161-Pyramimonas_sp.AAC.1
MEPFVGWNVGEFNRKVDFLPSPAPGATGVPILRPELPEEDGAIAAAGGDANEPNIPTPEARYFAEQAMDMMAFSVCDVHAPFFSLPDASGMSMAELVGAGILVLVARGPYLICDQETPRPS